MKSWLGLYTYMVSVCGGNTMLRTYNFIHAFDPTKNDATKKLLNNKV